MSTPSGTTLIRSFSRACEAVDPVSLKWLLDHGANPNCDRVGREHRGTALEYVIGSYVRSPKLGACIDLLVEAGGVSKYGAVVLDALRGNLDRVAAHLDADPAVTHRRFPQLDFGATGGRMLTLRGATLLHVAAEYVITTSDRAKFLSVPHWDMRLTFEMKPPPATRRKP